MPFSILQYVNVPIIIFKGSEFPSSKQVKIFLIKNRLFEEDVAVRMEIIK